MKTIETMKIHMNEWWKNPVLQGEENDYGDYDYLANELPDNSCRWYFNLRSPYRSDSSGKYSRLVRCQTTYFYCYDGWDSMSYMETWREVMRDWIRRKKRNFTHPTKRLANICKLCYIKHNKKNAYLKAHDLNPVSWKETWKYCAGLIDECYKHGHEFDITDWC